MTDTKKPKENNDQAAPGRADQAVGSGNAPGVHPDKDLSNDHPDRFPGIGLDRGDIFLDEFGREIPDPTPMSPPVGYKRTPTMVEIIRQQIQGEALKRAAAEMGKESWEDADDFDIGDDFDPTSPWEEQFDPVGYAPGALQAHERRFLAAQAARAAQTAEGRPGEDTSPPAPPEGPKASDPKGRPPQPKQAE